ncbi:MAG: hypothetical protein HYZ28_22420 [Myxococcales bacterium]|nr:hypothetical protein [Myxococcales bacterium]
MSEPTRLLDSGSDLERSLLRSALSDAPSEASRQAAAAALGIGAPGPGTPSPSGAAVTKAGISAFAKWAVVAALGGVMAGGAFHFALLRADPAPEATAPAVHPSAPSRVEQSAPVTAPPITRTQPPSAIPAPEVRAPRAPPSQPPRPPEPERRHQAPLEQPIAGEAPAAGAPAAAPDTSTLAEEIALLDSVRVALARKDAEAASASLAEYAARFPSGVLAPEAEALKIEVELEGGRRVAAERLAEEFFRRHPRSPLAARLRALLERAPK